MKKKFNNMACSQKFDKIYYYTTKNIEPGTELFIDYGKDYRKVNLGMKGTY
jgi:SET domain-containing protein